MFQHLFPLEPFLFAFGLVASSLCWMPYTRSRSRRREPSTEDTERPPPRSPLPRRRRTGSPPPSSTRLTLQRQSSLVDYDLLNPLEPPLTVFAEYTHPEIIIAPPPGAPRKAEDPQILRSRSLPSKRRKRHHHRRYHSPDELPSSNPSTNPVVLPQHVRSDSPDPPNPHSLLLHPKAKSTKPEAPSAPSNPASASRPSKPGDKSRHPIKKPPIQPPSSEVNPKSLPATTEVASGINPKSIPVTSLISSYSYETDSSSDEYESSTPEDTASAKKSSINSIQADTLLQQCRALLTLAYDQRVSLLQFDEYLKKTGLHFFNPSKCSEDRPFKCLGIFGCPQVGKSESASSLNAFINGIRQTTSSKKFYKWTNEKSNCNMYHYCNDSFSTESGIDFSKLLTSFNSVVFSSPGRHFMVIEGHRIFESPEIMALCDYKVLLTGSHSTLMKRKRPPTQQSFDLFVARVTPHLRQINSDKNLLKLDAKLGPVSMSKCIAAYVVMTELGLPNPGKVMSGPKAVLEIKELKTVNPKDL